MYVLLCTKVLQLLKCLQKYTYFYNIEQKKDWFFNLDWKSRVYEYIKKVRKYIQRGEKGCDSFERVIFPNPNLYFNETEKNAQQ